MSAASFSGYGLLRQLWPQKSIYEEILDKSPVLGLIKKDTKFGEEKRHIAVGIAGPQGIAGNFGDSKKYKTASKSEKFAIETSSYYGTFSVEGKLWRRYEMTGDKGIIVDPMGRDSKNLMIQIQNDLSTFIHGNGGGAIGRMTSTSTPAASNQITLRAGADSRRFELGMWLQTSTADGRSGTIKNGAVQVKAIKGTETAPIIEVEQSTWLAGIGDVAASDYIFRAGAYGSGAGGDGIINGFDAWFPLHTGTPGPFLGADRDKYANKLAGQCLDGTKMSPRQRVMRASRLNADVKGNRGRLIYAMSTRNWENLYNELTQANALVMSKAPAEKVGSISVGVEYDTIKLIGAGGMLQCVADPWMPDDVERLMNMDTMTLASTGELVHWDDGATPDRPMLEDGADAREVRAVGDIAFYCEAPWYQVRVAVAA